VPFVSTSQRRACYAKRRDGTAGSWDCDEWAAHTPNTKLPEKKGFAMVASIARQAAEAGLVNKLAADCSITAELVGHLARLGGTDASTLAKLAYADPKTFVVFMKAASGALPAAVVKLAGGQNMLVHKLVAAMKAKAQQPQQVQAQAPQPQQPQQPQQPAGPTQTAVAQADTAMQIAGQMQKAQPAAPQAAAPQAAPQAKPQAPQAAAPATKPVKPRPKMAFDDLARLAELTGRAAAGKPSVVVKIARAFRAESGRLLCSYLDAVAQKLPLEKAASVRVVQTQVSQDKDLSEAIKLAYPMLTGEQRGILAARFVKHALAWHRKRSADFGSLTGGGQGINTQGMAMPTSSMKSWNGPVAQAPGQMAQIA
jgi:hypothetical protein